MQGLRVLLVDGEHSSLLIEGQLRQPELQYTVTCCGSSSEALVFSKGASSSFDVVLAEAKLVASDEVTGRAFVDAFEDTPVVLMSEGSDTDDVMRAVRLGAVDFLDKPLSLLKLKNIWQHSVRKMMQRTTLYDSSYTPAYSESFALHLQSQPSISNCLPSSMTAPMALNTTAASHHHTQHHHQQQHSLHLPDISSLHKSGSEKTICQQRSSVDSPGTPSAGDMEPSESQISADGSIHGAGRGICSESLPPVGMLSLDCGNTSDATFDAHNTDFTIIADTAADTTTTTTTTTTGTTLSGDDQCTTKSINGADAENAAIIGNSSPTSIVPMNASTAGTTKSPLIAADGIASATGAGQWDSTLSHALQHGCVWGTPIHGQGQSIPQPPLPCPSTALAGAGFKTASDAMMPTTTHTSPRGGPLAFPVIQSLPPLLPSTHANSSAPLLVKQRASSFDNYFMNTSTTTTNASSISAHSFALPSTSRVVKSDALPLTSAPQVPSDFLSVGKAKNENGPLGLKLKKSDSLLNLINSALVSPACARHEGGSVSVVGNVKGQLQYLQRISV